MVFLELKRLVWAAYEEKAQAVYAQKTVLAYDTHVFAVVDDFEAEKELFGDWFFAVVAIGHGFLLSGANAAAVSADGADTTGSSSDHCRPTLSAGVTAQVVIVGGITLGGRTYCRFYFLFVVFIDFFLFVGG